MNEPFYALNHQIRFWLHSFGVNMSFLIIWKYITNYRTLYELYQMGRSNQQLLFITYIISYFENEICGGKMAKKNRNLSKKIIAMKGKILDHRKILSILLSIMKAIRVEKLYQIINALLIIDQINNKS